MRRKRHAVERSEHYILTSCFVGKNISPWSGRTDLDESEDMPDSASEPKSWLCVVQDVAEADDVVEDEETTRGKDVPPPLTPASLGKPWPFSPLSACDAMLSDENPNTSSASASASCRCGFPWSMTMMVLLLLALCELTMPLS